MLWQTGATWTHLCTVLDHQCVVFTSFSNSRMQSELMFWVTCQCAAQLCMISSVCSNDNTTTLCNDTKGGTYLSTKAWFYKWKCLSCPATLSVPSPWASTGQCYESIPPSFSMCVRRCDMPNRYSLKISCPIFTHLSNPFSTPARTIGRGSQLWDWKPLCLQYSPQHYIYFGWIYA